jgi:hypothetical protein
MLSPITSTVDPAASAFSRDPPQAMSMDTKIAPRRYATARAHHRSMPVIISAIVQDRRS